MATISAVLPVIHNITNKILIEQDDDTTLTKDIKRSIVASLNARYSDSELKELLEISTFLDPRFKTDYCEDDDSKRILINQVKAKLQSVQVIALEEQASTSNSVNEAEQEPPLKKRKLLTFLQKSNDNSEETGGLTQEEKVERK